MERIKMMQQSDQSNALQAAANEKSRLTLATSRATGKMWCGYHQGHVDADAGSFVERNGKRWMCDACMKLRNIPAMK